MKIRTVIFDLDNTLYDYNHCHILGLHQAFQQWQNLNQTESFEEFQHLYQKSREWVKRFLFDTPSSHSRALYFQKLVEKVEGFPNTYKIIQLYDAYNNGFYKELVPFPHLIEVINELKKRKFQLAVVTNMLAEIQYRKLTLLNLGDTFDFIITSQAVEHEKPHPLIYAHTLTLTQSKPNETIMIGDSFNDDIEPSTWIGTHAIWFNPRKISPPSSINRKYYVISEYSQLLSIIDEINT